MANRHTLHISKLEDFKEWLVKDGWEIEEPKGIWEVLRARKSGRQNPLMVYRKADAKEHLSIMDRDSDVVGAFLRDCKKTKTNADRIRSMSDEELAEFISKVNRTCIVDALGGDTQCDYEDVNCTECKAKFCGIQKWLQSEVEVQSMKWLMRKILKQVVKLYFFIDKECYCFHIGTKHPNYDYTVTKNMYPD